MAPIPARFTIYFCRICRIPAPKAIRQARLTATKVAWFFFPGAVGLYKNGTLVGGLGVSGDGVDQDDFVTAGGSVGFEAPTAIRADQIFINGVRLPYLKFPRNPTF